MEARMESLAIVGLGLAVWISVLLYRIDRRTVAMGRALNRLLREAKPKLFPDDLRNDMELWRTID
jgi:hypothetical protein